MTISQPDKPKAHAVALFSGGLDSALAVLLMLKQNIKVTALTFMTHFGCDLQDRSSCGHNPYPMADKFGFDVKLMHLGQKFVDIVENPKYGRGSEMNVCVDCRILMLEEARDFMEMVGADFLITGEVMGQRPFSQVKDRLNLTANKAGVKDILLRPLSAKRLSITRPEREGLVDREQLEGITGRGRRRQILLAKEHGLDDYPSSGGGCLLTDHGYSNRLRDLLAHTEHITFDDLNLLRVGRHFRLDKSTKVIVGRDESDNDQLIRLKKDHHLVLEALDTGSPLTLLIGPGTEDNIRKAAMITARYTKLKNSPTVRVGLIETEEPMEVEVRPAREEDLTPVLIR